MKLGLIGLGNLGTPLAKNLLKAGYPLTLYDLRREAATKLLAAGATWAESPQAVAEQAETVLTVLPSPAAVAAVVEGEQGLLQGLKAGSTWIDISTTDRRETQRLAGLCAAKGVGMLEAPMTGGIPLAHRGEMTILVGGDRAVFERNLPVLQAIGGKILHLGPVGSAAVAKVVTNMLAAIHLWALGEGLALGTSAGLAVGPLFEAIKASCGNSYVAETEGPEILNGSYDYGFTFALQAKDANLAYELGREFGVPLAMGGLVEQLIARARHKYGDEAWSTALVKLLEDDLGLSFRAAGYETPRIER
jgi:3-hydroxyisobutyrate dehydrogenase